MYMTASNKFDSELSQKRNLINVLYSMTVYRSLLYNDTSVLIYLVLTFWLLRMRHIINRASRQRRWRGARVNLLFTIDNILRVNLLFTIDNVLRSPARQATVDFENLLHSAIEERVEDCNQHSTPKPDDTDHDPGHVELLHVSKTLIRTTRATT